MWYYSSKDQFQGLMEVLDPEKWETDLIRAINEMKDDIIKQMAITESLTQQHKGTKKAMLDIENSECIQCQQNDNSRVQSMFHIYNFTIEKSWELCAPSHRQSCNF